MSGSLYWERPASTFPAWDAIDYTYFNGKSTSLTITGARYVPPNLPSVSGLYMMNADSLLPYNISMEVTSNVIGNWGTDAALRTTHSATFAPHMGENDLKFTKLSFTPSTGLFTSTGTLYMRDEFGMVTSSSILTFRGIVTRSDATKIAGYGAGFFVKSFYESLFIYDDETDREFVQRVPVLSSGHVKITPKATP